MFTSMCFDLSTEFEGCVGSNNRQEMIADDELKTCGYVYSSFAMFSSEIRCVMDRLYIANYG